MPLIRYTQPLQPASLQPLPLYLVGVAAGFPSPADDFIEGELDLNQYIVKHPAATFFAWCDGDSLRDLGIADGDLLVVDRSLEALQGSIVVVALYGELTCKILDKKGQRLLAANPDYLPIPLQGIDDLLIEGVVTHLIKRHLS